jgi:hypothetical protein
MSPSHRHSLLLDLAGAAWPTSIVVLAVARVMVASVVGTEGASEMHQLSEGAVMSL